MKTHIQNRVTENAVESDLVYALEKGYSYDAELDPKWVRFMLRSQFGVKDINNKYTITLKTNSGREIMVTNHDGKYWLTEKKP